MRLAAVALVAAMMLGTAQPVAAAALAAKVSPGTVVVGDRGRGVWTTIYATGVPSWVELIDAELTGPGGQEILIDLNIRNRPGVWEADVQFNRFDQPGAWKGKLVFRDDADRIAGGPSLVFHVKRRTTLSSVSSRGRGGGVSGILRKVRDDGGFMPYAKQKVLLYRWDGAWTYVAADSTDSKGRYAFKGRTGKFQVRFAGTAVNASSTRTTG